MEIKLSGWKGAAAGIAILAFLGYQFHAARASLDGAGREVIAQWLAAEYQRYHLARTDLDDDQRARLLVEAAEVDIVSLAARGQPESLAVRVEISPGPAHPPGSPVVRYYRMEHSLLRGWHHRGNLRPWQYYLTLF